jgi:hypothetical protein
MQGHEIAGYYELIAAVYRLALHDATKGKQPAIHWLNYVCPDWRQLQRRYKRRRVSRTGSISVATV